MADTSWYYAIDRRQHGPVTFEALRALLAEGKIGRDSLVWEEGTPDWREAGTVAELFERPLPGSQAQTRQPTPPPPLQSPGIKSGGWACGSGPMGGASRLPRRARTALILGILGLVFAPAQFVLGIIAVALAGTAMVEMNRTQNRRGYGVAVVALVIGIFEIVRRAPVRPW